jgi:hypothetical protein
MGQIIDCNQIPAVGSLHHVAEHKQLGMFEFKPENLLYYQAIPNGIKPQRLRWQRSSFKRPDIKLANLNIALFLIENIDLVPLEMKEEDEKGETAYFYFLGTIVGGCMSSEYVPYLHWNKKENTLDYGERDEECFVDKTDFVVAIK